MLPTSSRVPVYNRLRSGSSVTAYGRRRRKELLKDIQEQLPAPPTASAKRDRTIYALGGVSGSGKTYLRSTHPRLKGLTCIDIASIYNFAQKAGEHLEWHEALDVFEAVVQDQLESGQNDLVLEAFFAPGLQQRARIDALAEEMDVRVVYIWCAAPQEVCQQRVQSDTTDNRARHEARMRFVATSSSRWFLPRPHESAEAVLGLD